MVKLVSTRTSRLFTAKLLTRQLYMMTWCHSSVCAGFYNSLCWTSRGSYCPISPASIKPVYMVVQLSCVTITPHCFFSSKNLMRMHFLSSRLLTAVLNNTGPSSDLCIPHWRLASCWNSCYYSESYESSNDLLSFHLTVHLYCLYFIHRSMKVWRKTALKDLVQWR